MKLGVYGLYGEKDSILIKKSIFYNLKRIIVIQKEGEKGQGIYYANSIKK